MPPETRYAKSGDVNIAYQVLGKGPPDLVLVPGWVSNIDVFWEEPAFARFLNRLAEFSRLILFDMRGVGRPLIHLDDVSSGIDQKRDWKSEVAMPVEQVAIENVVDASDIV